MTHPYAIPQDLRREPWWPRVESRSIDDVLDHVTEDTSNTLVLDVLEVNRVSIKASRHTIDALLKRETVGAWVQKWKPLPQLVKQGRLEMLRRALAELGQVLAKMGEVKVDTDLPLGLLATMDVRVLADRRNILRVDVPGVVYASLPTWGPPMALAAYVETPYGRDKATRRWFGQLAAELEASVESDAPARSARLALWEANATTPLTRALWALRESLQPGQVPVTQQLLDVSKLSWRSSTDELAVEANALFGCMSGPCMTATVTIVGDMPTVACRRGPMPCRLKLLAVERVLGALVDPATDAPALAEHFRKPSWRRVLGRLKRIGEPDPGRDPQTLGWVMKSPEELTLAWIEPKRGGGVKSKNLTHSELDSVELEHTTDALALALVQSEAPRHFESPVDRRARVAKALAALTGSERVYARRDKELVPVRVVQVQPMIAAEPGEHGQQLVVRWGEHVVPATHEPVPGEWTSTYDPSRSLVHVGFWSRSAYRAWLALQGTQAIPDEGGAELAETLLGLGAKVAVKKDVSWLGGAHAPAPDIVFRLGLEGPRGEKFLTVEGRVHPVPELGAMLPGDGEDIVPVRRDGKVGHVVRALEAERLAVHTAAMAAGLVIDDGAAGPALFDWRVDGLEAAATTWTALDALARESKTPVRLEWRTKEPKVQKNRRVDKLRLRLGVRKDWLDIGGGFTLDGGELPLRELLEALRDHKRFVQLDDESVLEIGDALAKELAPLAALARGAGGGGVGSGSGAAAKEGMRASMLAAPLIAELEAAGAEVEGPPEWLMASARLTEASSLDVPMPSGLAAELRPYQKEGIVWLARLAHWAHGACLADDMGLGKTMQALAFLLHRQHEGPALVVAPTSVVPNWLREAKRFAPTLSFAAISKGADIGRLEAGHAVIVTSWDLVVRHEGRFAQTEWATVVFDEAHAMKNAATRRAQVARGLPARFVVALTGTPVENRPSELWSLFQTVAPGLLGSAESFRDTFAKAIETGEGEAARRLGRLVRPFLLRRKKSEVASDLPARSDVRVDVVLTSDERERYEKVRKSALAELAKDGIEGLAGGKGMLKVLVVLTRLRQLACHPRLVDPKAGPSSSKLERLIELVGELREEGRKVLVFSQFTELLALVRAAFDEAGFSHAYLDGSTPADKRIDAVDRFQSGAVDAFVLSLKAGGVGLNLTTATEVIHLDPWWNPAVEDQATDRAHRIGQDKPVTVYRMVAQGTIEEQILGLHGDKRRMVASLLEGTGSAVPVTVDELVALLSEDGLEAWAPDLAPDPGIYHAVDKTRVMTSLDAPRLPAPTPPQATPPPKASRKKTITVEASAPEVEPPAPPAPTEDDPVERALAVLREAGGAPMRRAEILAAAGLDEATWDDVRGVIDGDDRVVSEGQRRGRTYRWR